MLEAFILVIWSFDVGGFGGARLSGLGFAGYGPVLLGGCIWPGWRAKLRGASVVLKLAHFFALRASRIHRRVRLIIAIHCIMCVVYDRWI